MLLPLRMAAIARLAAALLAVTLSGAPRVAALHAPEEVHRCTCRVGGGERHECGCATCHKSAQAARGSEASAPRCHRAPDATELAERAPRAPVGAACLEGTCGTTDRLAVTLGGVEPCVVPASGPAAVADRVERRIGVADRPPDASREPETPPPRAA